MRKNSSLIPVSVPFIVCHLSIVYYLIKTKCPLKIMIETKGVVSETVHCTCRSEKQNPKVHPATSNCISP